MVLPLCLGISLELGAPLPVFISELIVAWGSGAPLNLISSASGLAVIMGGAIQQLGTFEVVLAATVLAGVLQLLLGVARAGSESAAAPTAAPIYFKLAEHVFFPNKVSIGKTLSEVPVHPHTMIDGPAPFIDYDAVETIENFRLSAPERGINLELRAIPQLQVLGH